MDTTFGVQMETKLAKHSSPAAVRKDGRALSKCPRFKYKRIVMFSEVVEVAYVPRDHHVDQDEDDDDDENPGGGVVRVKVVLTKKQLRQIVATMDRARDGCSGGEAAGSAGCHQYHSAAEFRAVDDLMNVLLRRHKKRAPETGKGCSRRQWRPELQSIPEEIRG